MDPQVIQPGRTAAFVSAASVVILFAATKVMAPVLSPVLVAILLALTIKPLVDWLSRRWLGRGFALLVSFALVVAVGLGLISLIGVALGQLRDILPTYEGRLRDVLSGLQMQLASRGVDISGLVSSDAMSAKRIVSILQRLLGVIRPLLSGGFLILFLVVLFLAEMPVLEKIIERDRSRQWLQLTAGIQKYIGLTGLMGSINALLNLGLLLLLGVDFPVLWAVMCFFFNFVPAVGNLIALMPPALLALLEFGWQRALIVVVGFFVTNLAMDLVLKPRLMKTSLNISPLLVILSLIFWGWLLGPVGPILAIPLTMVVQRGFFHAAAEEENVAAATDAGSVSRK